MKYSFQAPDDGWKLFLETVWRSAQLESPETEAFLRSIFLSGAVWAVGEFIENLTTDRPRPVEKFAKATTDWGEQLTQRANESVLEITDLALTMLQTSSTSSVLHKCSGIS